MEQHGITKIEVEYIFPSDIEISNEVEAGGKAGSTVLTDVDNRIEEILSNLSNIARSKRLYLITTPPPSSTQPTLQFNTTHPPVVVLLTYDDTKVLNYAYQHNMLKGDYVFIVVEGVDEYLQGGLRDMGRTDTEIEEVKYMKTLHLKSYYHEQ